MSPSANELCAANGYSFRRFRFPSLEQIGEDFWPEDDTADDCIDYYCEYIYENKVILKSQQTRILKVDLKLMEFVGDLLLRRIGEPDSGPPSHQQYAGRYYTDLCHLFKCHEFIVTVNRRKDRSKPGQRKYSLTFYRIEDILADWGTG